LVDALTPRWCVPTVAVEGGELHHRPGAGRRPVPIIGGRFDALLLRGVAATGCADRQMVDAVIHDRYSVT